MTPLRETLTLRDTLIEALRLSHKMQTTSMEYPKTFKQLDALLTDALARCDEPPTVHINTRDAAGVTHPVAPALASAVREAADALLKSEKSSVAAPAVGGMTLPMLDVWLDAIVKPEITDAAREGLADRIHVLFASLSAPATPEVPAVRCASCSGWPIGRDSHGTATTLCTNCARAMDLGGKIIPAPAKPPTLIPLGITTATLDAMKAEQAALHAPSDGPSLEEGRRLHTAVATAHFDYGEISIANADEACDVATAADAALDAWMVRAATPAVLRELK